jgi:hypothetical protein
MTHEPQHVPYGTAGTVTLSVERMDRLYAVRDAARARENAEERLADAEEIKGEIVTPDRIRLIARLRTERAEAILVVRAALTEEAR